jgi:hypothetical protein
MDGIIIANPCSPVVIVCKRKKQDKDRKSEHLGGNPQRVWRRTGNQPFCPAPPLRPPPRPRMGMRFGILVDEREIPQQEGRGRHREPRKLSSLAVLIHREDFMEFIRTKCQSPHCPAMACPSATGYCSYHDLKRTPYGQRPGQVVHPWLKDVEPITMMVQ